MYVDAFITAEEMGAQNSYCLSTTVIRNEGIIFMRLMAEWTPRKKKP
jgi:hypothetical protein